MASLLLVFVLAVCYSVYQYYSMLEIKTKQLNEQQAELDAAQITLVEREKELEEANATLVGKQEDRRPAWRENGYHPGAEHGAEPRRA